MEICEFENLKVYEFENLGAWRCQSEVQRIFNRTDSPHIKIQIINFKLREVENDNLISGMTNVMFLC